MISRFKQLGKDSIIYGLGGITAKAAGFFLLPVYTRIFNPTDYGTIEMLVVLNSFLGAILVMGMDSAQSFYFFEQKNKGQKAQARVVTAILQWRITWGTAIVIGSTFLSPLLNHFFFNGQLSIEYFIIAFASAFFTQIMIQSAQVFRLLYKPVGYISITLGKVLLSAAVALILILGFDFGILGFFCGALTGALISALFGWWRIRNYLDWSALHRTWWPRLLRFGAPLVPGGIAMYVLNTSDRWFISYYHGQNDLGLYAVGAKFAMLIAMAAITFRQAWWPVAMDAMHSSDGPALFRTIGRFYLGCGAAAVVFLTALSPYLVRWLTPPDYSQAYPIVGVLSWHAIFYGLYLIISAGIWKAEKTSWTPFLIGSAALLNIGLDAWLVPIYGGMGAAVATSISFLVWNVLTIIVSERLWSVRFRFRIMALQVLIGMLACGLILYVYNLDISPLIAWVTACLAIIILLRLSLSRQHLQKMIDHGRRLNIHDLWYKSKLKRGKR